MKITAGKVLQTYYELRQKRGPKPPAFLRKRTWKHADDFLSWCAKEGVTEPLAYLDYRFRVGDHGGYIPKLNQLRSNNLAEVFNAEWMQFQRSADVGYQKLKQRSGDRNKQALTALRLLTPGMEAAKHPYVSTGRYELCLAEISLTQGFHPESRYCVRCPQAVRCAAKLYQTHGFDVVALRAGRLKDLPPEIAAAAIK